MGIPHRPFGLNPFVPIFLDFYGSSILTFSRGSLLFPSLNLGLVMIVCLLTFLILIQIFILIAVVMTNVEYANLAIFHCPSLSKKKNNFFCFSSDHNPVL